MASAVLCSDRNGFHGFASVCVCGKVLLLKPKTSIKIFDLSVLADDSNSAEACVLYIISL